MSRPMRRMERNKLNPSAYTTFQAFRTADSLEVKECQAAECEGYRNGWITKVDEHTDLGKQQADHIRRNSGRDFTTMDENGFTVFMFTPGQRCFRGTHTVLNDRPAVHIQRGGDYRANLGLTRRFKDAGEFVDAFATHQDQIATTIKRG